MTSGAPRPSSEWSRRAGLVRACSLVAAGGAVGTAARAVVGDLLRPGPSGLPWSTLAINVLGALLLGLLLERLVLGGDDVGRRRDLRLACGAGLLGGFTTYSALVLQVDGLARDGRPVLALGYAAASVLLGLLAAAVGIALAGRAGRRRRSARREGNR